MNPTTHIITDGEHGLIIAGLYALEREAKKRGNSTTSISAALLAERLNREVSRQIANGGDQ